MSKEMTPKDALEGIIWRLTSYEDDLELRETDKKEIEIINQALDRFELLEKENSNQSNLIKRLNRLIAKAKQENQDLYIQIKQLEKENEWLNEQATSFRRGNIGYSKKVIELEKENQALRDKLNINFEECADELCETLTQRDKLYDENLELQKENQELKEEIKDLKDNDKRKKAIDIVLKYEITLMKVKQFNYEGYVNFCKYVNLLIPTQQEYDLLKRWLDE